MSAIILHNLAPRLPKLPASSQTTLQGVGNSFIITNRLNPTWSGYVWDEVANIVPLSGGNLWWYMSTVGINDPTPGDYHRQYDHPSTEAPISFLNSIVLQLKSQNTPQLTVFVHGLGTEWKDAINDTATLGANLRQVGYQGLVIGFDWPSYGETMSGSFYASSYPPAATSGTIRDNINGSVAAYGNLMNFLGVLRRSIPSLTVNLVCHSEGNYMAMLGTAGLSGFLVNQTVLLAADINNGAFQLQDGNLVGQAAALAGTSSRVTVYFSNSDNVLADSQGLYQDDPLLLTPLYHNPLYGARMGLTGPAYDQGQQQPNVHSVNCSAVINEQIIGALREAKRIPASVILHSSYFYVPQILRDIAATLVGTPARSVPNRVATANTNAYLMELNSTATE